jgi:hypothetical protein
MTPTDWLTCLLPRRLFQTLSGPAAQRKLFLFGCACWRRLVHLLPPAAAAFLDAAAARADGRLGGAAWGAARSRLGAALAEGRPLPPREERARQDLLGWARSATAWAAAQKAAGAARRAAKWGGAWAVAAEDRCQCELVRDLFGDPARSPPGAGWLSANGGLVPRLARALYDDRAFADLPVLADALEDAGCADAVLLGHLREPARHARGCWALDLLRGEGAAAA